jgi:hypothetical protein
MSQVEASLSTWNIHWQTSNKRCERLNLLSPQIQVRTERAYSKAYVAKERIHVEIKNLIV